MKSPKVPDAMQTAQADFGGQLAAAGAQGVMGNPDVWNFYGSQTHSPGEDVTIIGPNGQPMTVNRPVVHQNMSPAEQTIARYEQGSRSNIGKTAQETTARLHDYMKEGVDKSGWTPWNTGPQAAGYTMRQDAEPTDRAGIQDAIIKAYTRQADPRNAAEMARLTAQGAGAGTEIARQATQGQGDEFANAANQAYLASGQEHRAEQDAYNQVSKDRFAMAGTEADRNNTTRQAQEQSSYAGRNQFLTELMSLLGASGPQVAQYQPYQSQGVNAPNIAGLVQKQYESQANATNAFNSGLFGIGSSFLTSGILGPGGAFA